MAKFFPVAAEEEFSDGRGKAVSVEGHDVAVFKVGAEYFAIANECPHYGAELCDGYVQDEAVSCPWHGWRFDLRTGKCLMPIGYDVESFEVKIEDGQVKVAIGE